MRKMNRLGSKKENFVYLLLWVLLFATPILSMAVRGHQELEPFDWMEVVGVWKVYLLYLILFLLHNFLLAPLLVFRKRRWLYFSVTAFLLTAFVVWRCVNRPPLPPHHDMEKGRTVLRGERPADFTPPPPARGPMPDKPRNLNEKMHREEPPLFFGQNELMGGLFAILLIGMNLGVKLYFKSEEDQKDYAELKQHSLEQQLEYLRYQINPHFFMNTLNNIHALVDIDPERSKTSIVELSKLMRYVLYEGAKDSVPLSRDVDFVRNYITLMRLRYTDKVSVRVDIPEMLPDRAIAPMIFISFVENAFKHGVSYQKDSFVDVALRCDGDRLTFSCRNSKHSNGGDQQGGVGLENVRKRLDLLYGGEYQLDIDDGEKEYNVRLSLSLNNNSL